MTNTKLTREELKENLRYEPDTGDFYWIRSRRGILADQKAGYKEDHNGREYIRVNFNNKRFYAHRLVFFYTYGKWPKYVDHIDGNGTNNQLKNLRICTQSQNLANTGIQINNTSGYKGIYWSKGNKRWHARITIKSKQRHLGYFKCKHEAARAYNKAAKKLFGEFAFLNKIIEDKND